MNHNISIIGTVGVPACYGGFESLVENLLPSDKIGLIYCSANSYSEVHSTYKGSKLKYLPLDANGVQSIPYDIISILHSLFFTKNDLLVLGVSGAICLPLVRLFSKRKIITNIDGLEWRRDKWGKYAKKFLKYSEALAVKHSDIVIADNKAISDYVVDEYGVVPSIIAYGGDHALVDSSERYTKQDYSLALCRIEPENNVHAILEAFSRTPQRKLKFIGNWDKSSYGQELKSKYSVFPNISIVDPVYDLDVLFQYRAQCSSYIHGHSAGGTNPSLVEMMFFGIPIVCFDCSYNRASTEDKGLYFQNSDHLVSMLNERSDLISEVGGEMKEIAYRRYTWQIVKEQYLSLFE